MQKDYWRMSEEELTKLAEACHIPPLSQRDDIPGADFFFNRDRVINALLVRDTALRTRWTVGISIFALFFSLSALGVSTASFILNYYDTVDSVEKIAPVQH
jgi:hypothetical protein